MEVGSRIAYVGGDSVNRMDPTGQCSAAAAGTAGVAAIADGPVPAGDVIGVGILAGPASTAPTKPIAPTKPSRRLPMSLNRATFREPTNRMLKMRLAIRKIGQAG